MAALSALTLRAVWIAPYLPTNDGPQHILSAHVENHYSDPATPFYAETLLPSPQFAYKGFAALYGPLEAAFGWREGLHVALAIMTLGVAWAFAAAVLALEPRRRFVAYAGFALAWMWPLYMGFFAYVVGTAIGFAILAYAIRATALGAKALAVLALGLLVDSVAHVFTGALTWAILAVIVLARADRKARVRDTGKVVLLAIVPLGLTFAASRFEGSHASAPLSVPFLQRLQITPRVLLPGPSWRAWIATAVLVAVLVFVARRFRRLSAVDRAAYLCGVGLLAIGVLAPRDIKDWQFFAPRLLPVGALLALLVTPVEDARPAIAGAVAFVLSAGSVLASTGLNARFRDGCADAVGGVEAPVKRRFINLPIVIDAHCAIAPDPERSEVPYAAPLGQIGALVAAAQGGMTPYLFLGSPAAHAFKNREGGAGLPVLVPDEIAMHRTLGSKRFESDPDFRRAALTEQLWYGMGYEGVVVAGAEPRDIALLRDEGFYLDYARGSFVLAHFVPCAFDVTIPAAAAPKTLRIDAGLAQVPAAAFDLAAAPAHAIDPGGLAHFRVDSAPCGDVWVRVAPVRCANADAEGRLHANVTRSRASIACEPAPAPPP